MCCTRRPHHTQPHREGNEPVTPHKTATTKKTERMTRKIHLPNNYILADEARFQFPADETNADTFHINKMGNIFIVDSDTEELKAIGQIRRELQEPYFSAQLYCCKDTRMRSNSPVRAVMHLIAEIYGD